VGNNHYPSSSFPGRFDKEEGKLSATGNNTDAI
jgi:hypothetical protein